ncbi:MAG: magnesium protoporphyrin IX methyltransferase [Hyphomicrobium sp.]|nr:magnesium protoporphyrin IX methyltransferase [Hyphomicrobium sp.]
MHTLSYRNRRREIETYFDRTASETWSRLTSDAPVSRIRATVRAGRDEMRAVLLAALPHDLTGRRILDAGCGTGALAREAARRGADVVAIDIAPSLVNVARDRASDAVPDPQFDTGKGRVEFLVGDMLDPALGRFDHIVAMDSLIHYRTPDMVAMIAALAARTNHSIHFTFAPGTRALMAMRAVGRLFPQGDRAPAIEPVEEQVLRRALQANTALSGWTPGPNQRVSRGFYKSEAMTIAREGAAA